jgi:hypothetical protein
VVDPLSIYSGALLTRCVFHRCSWSQQHPLLAEFELMVFDRLSPRRAA